MRKKQEEKEIALEEEYVSEVELMSQELLDAVQSAKEEAEKIYPQIAAMEELEPVEQQADSMKRAAGNLSKALVNLYMVDDELRARCKDVRKQRQKRVLLTNAPANTTIDLRENSSNHFAKGLNLYKLLLVCFIGSFAGVVVELLWCLLKNGYLESRSGLVYGPFNLLYGAGAVALTLCLYRFRNRGAWISFLGGFLVGSVVEYVCSWGQELVLGTRSWDYSQMPFNLNGRICLLYSIFWGFLGILWIKNIYPRMVKWILKIPNKIGKMVTWVLVVFFIFNSIMSMASVYRWSQRVDGVEASNGFAVFLDQRFPDERMERIYANMKFSERKHSSSSSQSF